MSKSEGTRCWEYQFGDRLVAVRCGYYVMRQRRVTAVEAVVRFGMEIGSIS